MKVQISFDIDNKEHLKEILLALKECGCDVVEIDVKEDTAYWIYDSHYGGYYTCSKCGHKKGSKDDVCPKCGSKMIDREVR